METFWDLQQVVPRHNGFHEPAFPATRGTTQGGLVSLTIFNLVVGNVIRTWLTKKVEDQKVDNDGLVKTIRRCLGLLYDNDGILGSRDADWQQHLINILFSHF